MTEVHTGALARLVRAVAILALPYEDQLSWLRSLGLGEPGIADELGMELEDGELLSAQFEQAGWITAETRARVMELDGLLDRGVGTGEPEFWNLESLRTSSEWARIRQLALTTLFTF